MKRRKRKDFEIQFYEKLIEGSPNFVHALMCLGDAYTRGGFYKEGLAVDKRLAHLKPEDPIVYYNLACSLSLIEDAEAAFQALKRAVLLGYDDFDYILSDPDLEQVRGDARFHTFFKKITKLKCSP